jgi:hypothetical protein
MSMDEQDGSIDGLEQLDPEEIADADHPYGEVTAEDLGTDDLIDDGADAAAMIPDDPQTPVDAALHTEDLTHDDTIEDRLLQEEPDPSSRVIYGD